MRTIEFRGLTVDTKEMVFGDLIHGVGNKNSKVYILPNQINFAYVKTKSKPHYIDCYEVLPETIGQFTGLTDKNGVKIFEGDNIMFRRPYRTTQTHYGDNIPNGSYTEPMEAGIREREGVVFFNDGSFMLQGENMYDFYLIYACEQLDLDSIERAISCRASIFDDPEEGDLQYLIHEVAKVKTAEELLDYLSGCEIIGNIHETKEGGENE